MLSTSNFWRSFFGKEFLQQGLYPDPAIQAGKLVESAWAQVFGALKVALITQAGGAQLFDNGLAYDLTAGELTGSLDLSQSMIDDLVDYATDVGVDEYEYWLAVADYIEFTKGLDNVTGTEDGWLDTALYDSGLAETWVDIVYDYHGVDTGSTIDGTTGDDTIYGPSGDNLIRGFGGDDVLYGGAGDDTIQSGTTLETTGGDELYGEDGDDILEASWAHDILSPGAGGDRAEGQRGDDSYIYTSGNDVYYDAQGTDTLFLPSDIDSGDLTFHRLGNNDLLIEVGTLGTIQIEGQLNVSSNWTAIDTIEFYDTTTLNLLTIDSPVTHGTEEDDSLYGIQYGASGDDVIYGYGGDDLIYTTSGTNVVDGGAGNDEIHVEGTDDKVIASAGFDVIKISSQTDLTIEIPDQYSVDDLTLFRGGPSSYSFYSLFAFVEGLGQIKVENFFFGYAYDAEIVFADSSPTITLASTQIETHGTESGESISGITTNASVDDIIFAYGGADTITSGTGDDEIHGGGDVDTIYGGVGNDVIYGDDGNDVIRGEKDDDIIYGGDGDDTIYGGSHTSSGAYTGNDFLYGGNGNDTLRTYDGNSTFSGDAGNDTIYAGWQNDTIIFSSGLDTVTETYGDDVLHIAGGVTINDITVADVNTSDTEVVVNSGTDEVLLLSFRAHVYYKIETISFDDGFEADLTIYNSWIEGTAANDTVSGDGSANVLIGFAGADDMDAGAGADQVHGGAGNDTINGEGDNDLLHGGAGDDTLDGDGGDDILYGGDGLDTLWGDTGADSFVFMNDSAFNDVDVVKDFDVSTDNDVLDIIDILASNGYEDGIDAITNWVEMTTNGSDTDVKVDITGAGSFGAGTQIATLEGITGLTDEAALVSSGNLLVA